MADYFTHFSCLLDVGTHDNAARAVNLSMAETKCARWRRKSVPVWLIKKGGDARGSVCLV